MDRASRGRRLGLLMGLALMLAPQAVTAQEIGRGPAPDWVIVEEAPAAAVSSEGLRILLFDTQVRVNAEDEEVYQRIRSTALSPQALPILGNVTLSWRPASQAVTVHHVNIIRDGQVVDVLAAQDFEILRREQNLEQAVLDGRSTAVLQPAGLRVGDILDLAYTMRSRDPVIGAHFEQAMDFNTGSVIDTLRYRAAWPTERAVRARASDAWTPLDVRRVGAQSVLDLRFNGLEPIVIPDSLPTRLARVRLVELTEYGAWADIAVALKPLYDQARRIEADSPLHAEVERIRALSDDPKVQAGAALRLVQDQVRYVALLMGAGGLTPATADETWSRRFGDCKAKTALLLALLDALGIAAEPATVSMLEGDGLPERLPRMGAFDHVLVRVEIEGEVYWLDGTRSGDRDLDGIRTPPFHWALPLTGPGAELERLEVTPLALPDPEIHIAVDASAGLYTPAAVSGTLIMRGDSAALIGGQLALIAEARREQGLRALWLDQVNDLTISQVASAYDVEANVLTLTMAGTMSLDWRDRGLIPPGGAYQALTAEPRPEGRFQNAPYAIAHPGFTRKVAVLRLPNAGEGFHVSGGVIDRIELGHHIRRTVRLDGDTVTVDTTLRTLEAEISAAEAERGRKAGEARPSDPPRVFRPRDYRPTEADRAAWTAQTPTTAAGWLDRALALSQVEDWVGAVEAAGQAIALDPEDSSAWANRGVYRYWSGDRAGAAADLEKAVDLDPSERVAMNGNALLAMSEGRLEDAVIELSRALRQSPNDDFALNLRASLYVALDQPDRALRDIDALIAQRPSDQRLKFQRINVLNSAGRTAEADAEMDALFQASPEDRGVQINLAALRVARDDHARAIELLDGLLEPMPQNPEQALMLRAESRIALGDLEGAASDMAMVRERRRSDGAYLNDLCWMAATAGVLLDQALQDCDAAVALLPDDPAVLDSRGRVLLQIGRLDEALAAYEAALAKAPDQAASLYGRGLIRAARGEAVEGEADQALAVSKDPGIAEVFETYEPPASTEAP